MLVSSYKLLKTRISFIVSTTKNRYSINSSKFTLKSKVIWQFLHDPHQHMYPHCSIILNRKKAKYKCPTVQRFLNYSSLMVKNHGPIKKYQKTNFLTNVYLNTQPLTQGRTCIKKKKKANSQTVPDLQNQKLPPSNFYLHLRTTSL